MATFCLIPKVAEEFKKAIIEGKIDPAKLVDMTSLERRTVFEKYIGKDNAEPVNALFESKLLLKNQQQGMISWAERVLKDQPIVQRDIITKIQRLDKALTPKEQSAFLEDLVAQKLGVHVTFNEAAKIAELSKKVQETKGVGDRMDYGRSFVELNDYVNELKMKNEKVSLEDLKNKPGEIISKGISDVAGTAKAIKASMDDSAIFRQGWKVLWTHPSIWAKNSLKSFQDIINTFGKDTVMKELNADIYSRPNYDLMKKAKLAVGTAEEAFPTTIAEKIPILGKLYKASQDAYTAFVHKTRADVFDKYIDIAKKNEVDLTNTELESIGKLVNSLTGRGHLGKAEKVGELVNNIFFSPRLLKSHIDILTQPLTGSGGSNFVRKEASKNLLKIITGTATIMMIANTLRPGSAELDPRSADFGKIKIGNTRFDISGGMSSLIVLATRIIRRSTKSSTTGEITQLNQKDKEGKPKFGAKTTKDVIYDFTENKLSPASSVLKDLAEDSTFKGKKPTITNELENLFVPLPITNAIENYKTPGAANLLLTIIADGLGIATNTYAPKDKK